MSGPNGNRRVALVTGAARGIGAAIAERLIADGLEVIAVDMPGAPRPAPNPLRTDEACDLSDPAAPQALAAGLRRLDVLVNNAGVFARTPLREQDENGWEERILAVNALAPERLITAIAPALERGQAPAVVNIASVRGLTASEFAAAYSVSKAAVIDLTRRMSHEFPAIRFNAVAPGDIQTSMTPEPAVLARLLPRIPLGRLGQPVEVAHVVAFLASSRARAINGAVVPVDGGFLCG